MPIEKTISGIMDDLKAFTDPLERLEYLIDRSRTFPPMSDDDRTEENRIEGCMARLWMTTRFDGTTCHFQADSDSMVVKSIAGLLCELYDGATPQEILEHPPEFLAQAGITEHLSANRRNALTRVWARIRDFALRRRDPPV